MQASKKVANWQKKKEKLNSKSKSSAEKKGY